MTTDNRTQRVIKMPLAWRVFGSLFLLAIPCELLWLWKPEAGLVGKAMVAVMIAISMIAGLELLSFRLILDEQQVSLRIWPRRNLRRLYRDISDIRISEGRATSIVFDPIPRSENLGEFCGSKLRIPASVMNPERLANFLNQKLIGSRTSRNEG